MNFIGLSLLLICSARAMNPSKQGSEPSERDVLKEARENGIVLCSDDELLHMCEEYKLSSWSILQIRGERRHVAETLDRQSSGNYDGDFFLRRYYEHLRMPLSTNFVDQKKYNARTGRAFVDLTKAFTEAFPAEGECKLELNDIAIRIEFLARNAHGYNMFSEHFVKWTEDVSTALETKADYNATNSIKHILFCTYVKERVSLIGALRKKNLAAEAKTIEERNSEVFEEWMACVKGTYNPMNYLSLLTEVRERLETLKGLSANCKIAGDGDRGCLTIDPSDL